MAAKGGNIVLDTADLRRYVRKPIAELGYATVRDFCDSADHLAKLMRFDGDMKDVQRAWAFKAILGTLPIGSRLLEIGAGDPIVADALQKLGYDVTVVDPYDGTGGGPRAYEQYVGKYRGLKIVRASFEKNAVALTRETFDGIYSVSVLEHVPEEKLEGFFAGISDRLQPGGCSIHCVDHVVAGAGADWHRARIRGILLLQKKLQNPGLGAEELDRSIDATLPGFFRGIDEDVETYYLSALGHNVWRGGHPYNEFPFRRIVSVQTCVCLGK